MFRFHFYSFCHITVTICFFSDMDTIIKSHSHWTWVISIEEKCIELWVSNKIFEGDQNCPSSSGTRWDEPMHKKGKKTTVAVQNRSFHLIWIIIIASVYGPSNILSNFCQRWRHLEQSSRCSRFVWRHLLNKAPPIFWFGNRPFFLLVVPYCTFLLLTHFFKQ